MILRDNTNKENSLYHYYIFLLTGSRESDTTPYSYTDFIGGFNEGQDQLNLRLLTRDGKWQFEDSLHATPPIQTENLASEITVANNRLKIQRVRVKDKSGNWITLKGVDRHELSDSHLAEVGVPRVYDKLGNTLRLYPAPDYSSTGGLEMTFQRASDHFTASDTAVTPGYAEVFHTYPAAYSALSYARANGKDNRLVRIQNQLDRFEPLLNELMSQRDGDDQPRITLRPSRRIGGYLHRGGNYNRS